MSARVKRKLKVILKTAKIPLLILGLLWLVYSATLLPPSLKPSLWWSVLLTSSLKQTNGMTNFLLLGAPGGRQAGADLTDTMIFFSFNQKTAKTVLVSLPRDLWSPTLVAKINTAYHYGGLPLAKATAEEITGQPIHYVIKIDLVGFKEIIDLVGGIETKVERTFDDYQFPLEGKEEDLCDGDKEYKCRYQHVHFDAGDQLLDGEKAMQYIRSRGAEGEEGTDFARSRRQQKLILALKKKIFSPVFFLHPEKVWQLSKILSGTIETDISSESLVSLGRLIVKINYAEIKTLGLEELLMNPPVWQYGQWVLVPQSGDWKDIQEYLKARILE